MRPAANRSLAVGFGVLLLPLHAIAAEHLVPFFLAAGNPERSSFVRVINRSSIPGRVRVEAVDDSGRKPADVTLDIGANAVVHFNSRDLARGNPGKGLEGSIGRPVSGDWRLRLVSDLDLEVLSYVRARDGLVAAMHDTAPWSGGGLRIPFFNPGSNTRQMSLLRLLNVGAEDATVTVTGTDDTGAPSPGSVSLVIPAGAARTYSAPELESGTAAGLDGFLGDGVGKWRLDVRSEQPIIALGLLASPAGQVTNLSGDSTARSTLAFDFRRGPEGFVADFADYPPADSDFYRLVADHRPLPAPLEPHPALFLGGDNHSADLFMFFKARVGGLLPGASYFVAFQVEIATDVPTGCAGIGGAPGESVWVKAGATDVEPIPVLEGTHLRMNVDVGGQSRGGEAAVVLGNVTNSRSCEEAPEWELKSFPVRSLPAPVTASPEGRVWLLFGIDSGFKGRTEIYFTRASVTFMPVLGRA